MIKFIVMYNIYIQFHLSIILYWQFTVWSAKKSHTDKNGVTNKYGFYPGLLLCDVIFFRSTSHWKVALLQLHCLLKPEQTNSICDVEITGKVKSITIKCDQILLISERSYCYILIYWFPLGSRCFNLLFSLIFQKI